MGAPRHSRGGLVAGALGLVRYRRARWTAPHEPFSAPLPQEPSSRPRLAGSGRRLGSAALAALVVVCALAALSGDPFIVVVPMLLTALVIAAFALPLEVLVPVIVFVMVAVNAPAGHPGSDVFHWPLNPIGALLYTNLPTRFALADVIGGFVFLRALTTIGLSGTAGAVDRRPPKPFVQALMLSMLSIVAMEIYGIQNGGDIRQSLWQLRAPLGILLMAFAVSVAANDVAIRRIRLAFLAAGLIKAIEAIVAYWVAGLRAMPDVIFVTQHSDSVLWATCTAVLLAEWFEHRRSNDRLRFFVLVPFYGLAMIANNRRTVWVAVAAALLVIVLGAHRPVKRQLGHILSFTWPLILAYIALGLASHSVVFKPVHMIDSLLNQSDASSSTRDIENYNLLVTIRARPLVGWGFGHPYIEQIRAFDISQFFPQYRFLPHNSFLGYWAFNGLFGAGLFFLTFVVGAFYLAGTRRHSMVASRRSAATWAMCAIIAMLVQSWSDVGMQDWTSMVVVGVALGMGGALGRMTIAEQEVPAAAPELDYVEPDDVAAPPALMQRHDPITDTEPVPLRDTGSPDAELPVAPRELAAAGPTRC